MVNPLEMTVFGAEDRNSPMVAVYWLAVKFYLGIVVEAAIDGSSEGDTLEGGG